MIEQNEYIPMAVVLAAGKSTRFEGIKMLASICPSTLTDNSTLSSEPMLVHIINKLSQIDMSVAVALGKYRSEIQANLPEKVTVIACPDAEQGLGKTISNVIDWIEKFRPNCTHLFLCLGDAPALQVTDYQSLVIQSRENPTKIVCCENAKGIGAPAVFPKWMFEQLAKLNGDKGAKALIQENIREAKLVVMPRSSIDIDTQSDLKRFHKERG